MPIRRPTQAAFVRDLKALNEFYAAPEGLQRARGATEVAADLDGLVNWAWELQRGRSLDEIKARIRESQEWQQKHAPAPPAPTFPRPRPLHVAGPLFRDDEGNAWRWKMVTAFEAPKRFCEGDLDGLTRFAEWTRAVGGNGWRVFLQHVFLDWPTLKPWVTPIDRVRPFVDWCASQGLYVELVALCDCQEASLGVQFLDQQVARVKGVCEAAREAPNVFVEICNEPSQNGCDVRALVIEIGPALPACLLATGEYPITGHEANLPHLDYITDHMPRKAEWPTEAGKIGVNVYVQCGVPHVADEWVGAAEEMRPWDRDSNPENHEDAGGGIALASAGGTFHCDDGIFCRVPGPIQTECATRYFAAMDAFPADAVLGMYSHDSDAPWYPLKADNTLPGLKTVGEVVARVHGSSAYLAAAQPTSNWSPRGKDGWEIVARYGRGTQMLARRAG